MSIKSALGAIIAFVVVIGGYILEVTFWSY